jgi:hypothetical protein
MVCQGIMQRQTSTLFLQYPCPLPVSRSRIVSFVILYGFAIRETLHISQKPASTFYSINGLYSSLFHHVLCRVHHRLHGLDHVHRQSRRALYCHS